MDIKETNLQLFQNSVLVWYGEYKRSFPWRNTKEPFHILVSEKLLQQTKASDRVVNAYQKILDSYPTIQDLANANPLHLEEIFKPLGMFYRGKEMIRMANEIVLQFEGEIPRTLKDLQSIHGIGDYSARAVLSFAYGMRVPIVDTNIARLLIRLFDLKEIKTQNPARKKIFHEIAEGLLPSCEFRKFNYALLDICALVCKTHSPICHTCPINIFCKFYRE